MTIYIHGFSKCVGKSFPFRRHGITISPFDVGVRISLKSRQIDNLFKIFKLNKLNDFFFQLSGTDDMKSCFRMFLIKDTEGINEHGIVLCFGKSAHSYNVLFIRFKTSYSNIFISQFPQNIKIQSVMYYSNFFICNSEVFSDKVFNPFSQSYYSYRFLVSMTKQILPNNMFYGTGKIHPVIGSFIRYVLNLKPDKSKK